MPDLYTDPKDTITPLGTRRPLFLKIVFWIIFLWTFLGWLRFVRALADMDLILEWLSAPLYGYLIFAGLMWGLLGLPVLWGILVRASWTPKLILIAGILYPALYWFERLVLWAPSATQQNGLFMLLLTLVWLGIILATMRSKRVAHYFKIESA